MRQFVLVLLVVLLIAALATAGAAIWWGRQTMATNVAEIDSQHQIIQDLQKQIDATAREQKESPLLGERDRLRDELATVLLDMARYAEEKNDFAKAEALAKKSKEVRDTPEVQAYLKEIVGGAALEAQFQKLYADALRNEKAQKWTEAAQAWEEAYKLRPTATLRARINHDHAMKFSDDARVLEVAGEARAALKMWNSVLKYDPQSPLAKGRVDKLSHFINVDDLSKAGKQAMANRQWQQAIDLFKEMMGLVDATRPDEAALKADAEARIAEATRQMAAEVKRP